MSEVTVAATQMACSGNIDENIVKAESLIQKAANQGAQIILLQELFSTPYFCKDEKEEYALPLISYENAFLEFCSNL